MGFPANMTPQEIFDTCADHILRMPKQARRMPDLQCAYRGENGSRCAIGALIPDDVYRPWMDQFDDPSILGILQGMPHYFPDWMHTNRGLLFDLQRVHDDDANWFTRADLIDALKKVAKNHNLAPTVIPEVTPEPEDEYED